MNLVADEGVDKAIVDALRASGFSVKYFAEAGVGAADKEVLAAANDEQSLLLTCDKDFGELVFRQRQVHAGVVLIRLTGMTAAKKANMVLEAIKQHSPDMGGAFTVISAGLLRVRHRDPLPPQA
jgi:predicted nuclease of predicted toxin-antitoxin system